MSDFDDLELETELTTDPLLLAERLTGKSYKDDPLTDALGFGIMIEHNKNKERLLTERDDTSYGSDFATQLRVMQELGFEVVYEEQFESNYDYITEPETYMILWRDGILATLETFQTTGRNSAKMYYNYQPHGVGREASSRGSKLMSSGKMVQPEVDYTTGVWEFDEDKRVVIVGDHDIREAVRFTLYKMEREGEFLSKWIERPWLWLLNYMDVKTEDCDYEALTEARIAKLPQHVREAITPEA